MNPPKKSFWQQEILGSRKPTQRWKAEQEHNHVGWLKLDKILQNEALGQLLPKQVRL